MISLLRSLLKSAGANGVQGSLFLRSILIVIKFSYPRYTQHADACRLALALEFQATLFQVFQISQVLMPAGSLFVFLEILKINEVDRDPIHFLGGA